MRSPARRVSQHAVALALSLGACATSGAPAMLVDTTPIAVAGPRCSGATCACRGEGEEPVKPDEGAVPEGLRRIELRTGRGLDPTWVAVEGRGRLVKDVTTGAPSCAYVDLPPGRHRVHLHVDAAKPEEGIHPSLTINEWGAKAASWYDTLAFRCGQNDACTKDEVREEVDAIPSEGRGHGVLDPCGSVRVEGLRWAAERSPGARLEDLDIEMVLHIYKFTPRFPHGDPRCKAPHRDKQTVPSEE